LKIKLPIILAAFVLSQQAGAQITNVVPPPVVQVTIDAGKQYPPISKLVYGQFIELLFNYFEGGLWAEMIGDRKFFYPVNSNENLVPLNTRNYLGRWKPVGGDEFVTMDSTHVFVGEHSPGVRIEKNAEHGIQQQGLSLSAKPGVVVNVSLYNNEKKENKQILSFKNTTSSFKKYPLHFIAYDDTENASVEITGTGSGSFSIGTISLMPADNVEGFRKDILNHLKEMNMGMVRWGGNASSGYNWRDGIGNRDKRPPRYDYAWNAMESNDVGTDDYLNLCRLLNVEPYIGVNAGLGDAYSAAAWLQYVNGSASTPMGKLRAANGHQQPYKVKWWGIGNEMYGEWQLGHMSIDHYIIKHKIFAKEMRKVDPSINIVASGASPFETGSTSVYSTKPSLACTPYQFGSEQDWSGNLLARASNDFNYIAEHLYPISDSAYNEEKQAFVYVSDSLAYRIRRLPNRIKGAAEAYTEYVKRMPFIQQKGITIALDEWRMKDGWGLEDALSTAEGFQEIFRHTDIIKMSAYTSTSAPSCLLYNGTASALQPNGLAIKLYADHFGSIPIAVNGSTEQPQIQGTTGVDRPVVTSGSNTYPLDISAALTKDRKKITVAIVNPTLQPQQVNIKYTGMIIQKNAKSWTISGNDLKAINEPGKKPAIGIIGSLINDADGSLHLDAASITLFVIPLK
jgi:alpha-N-arabinofuranosidase